MSPTSMKGILLRGNTIIGKSLEARDPLGLKLVGCGGGQCGKDRLELHNERCVVGHTENLAFYCTE